MPDFNQSLPLPSSSPDDEDINASDVKSEPRDSAINLIRDKVNRLYSNEPEASDEEQEIENTGVHSKHQAYMKNLMDSGMGLAEIQNAWHEYYQKLPDDEKHEVWNEFYANQAKTSKLAKSIQAKADDQIDSKPKDTRKGMINKNQKIIAPLPKSESEKFAQEQEALAKERQEHIKEEKQVTPQIVGAVELPKTKPSQTAKETKDELINKVTARGKLKPKHHLQSLLFGMSMGLIVIFIFMFGFFNERFIAPFVTPSRTASNGPIIIDPTAKVGPESLIIIPKINVEVPVVYNTPSIAEADIQASLENGVVHYPTTPKPGENGNVVVVGHSSNNLLNRGKYKFAFVLLNRLEVGDTITMQYNSKRYVYKVYEKIIVKPDEVGVLGPTDKKASLSLITCDPPGTSINRLVVRAEQISPSTDNNVASTAQDVQASSVPQVVPGNAPSLFERLFGWL